jgi:hypothetical protein
VPRDPSQMGDQRYACGLFCFTRTEPLRSPRLVPDCATVS